MAKMCLRILAAILTRVASRPGCWLAGIALLLSGVTASQAAAVLQPWVPMFKGVEHAVGTNTPGAGGFENYQVVYFMRVDLTDPDIRLFASPRRTNWVANSTETYGYTMTNFLKNYGLQVAINANQFSPSSYFQAEGIACNASGMIITEGKLVSPGVTSGTSDAATMCFTSNNVPTYYPTNIPAASTNGVYTAVSGFYNILYNGVNVGSNYIGNNSFEHRVQPRTAMGLSQDRRYLYLLVIDGRQDSLGYSDGAYDWETAEWLKLAGAWDGANLDGGGSSCMVAMDSTGQPISINHDTASLTSPGFRQRTGGAHFGVYASPLPGFFNEVTVLPDTVTATITWTTISPATTQLKYGLTTNMNFLTVSNAVLTTNHAVLLTNLVPDTGYYFAALASIDNTLFVSSNYFFVTTNYVVTNVLFELTNTWKYTTTNLEATNWPARTYDDAAWEGAGEGLLWSDFRGPNGEIPVPLGTQMPEDSNTGYPFVTYYFRTHFNYPGQPAGAELQLEGYVDDGAVFYLNGTEIHRLRMPDAPATILNSTVAAGYPCGGDATCPDAVSLVGSLVATNLLAGDNVFAVEVHNYNPGSPDVTFGLSALATSPFTLGPELNITRSNSAVTLSWSRGGFTLQHADAPAGPWVDVPGPVISSPFTTNHTGTARFFRLRQ